jgi:hypothetical protein
MASTLHTVEASGLGQFMREALYAYPLAEAFHISGLALLFGSIVIVDLRLLGLGRQVALRPLVSFAVPWSIAGFLIAASTGALMFSAHAEEFVDQPLFLLKMGLIVAGGANAVLLRVGSLRGAGTLDAYARLPARMRFAAGLSILLWLGVIACGRMLAYF